MNSSERGLSVLLGNGDGTFRTRSVNEAYTEDLFAADLDGDGKPDLVATQDSSRAVYVFLGDGDGGFRGGGTYPTNGVLPVALTGADLDGDGDVDIATANYGVGGGTSSVSVLPNRGDGTLGTGKVFATGNGPQGITAADLGRGSKPDLATANTRSDDVSVLLNTTR